MSQVQKEKCTQSSQNRAAAIARMGFESFLLLQLKRALNPLSLASISSHLGGSPNPCQNHEVIHLGASLVCDHTANVVFVLFFSCFLSGCVSWNCDIVKLAALLKSLSSFWCLAGEYVQERIPLWEAAFLYTGWESEMGFRPSCENKSSWCNGQVSVRGLKNLWQTTIIKTQV